MAFGFKPCGVSYEDRAATEEAKRYSEKVLRIAIDPGGTGNGIDLATLVEKIEMLSRFQLEKDQD
jgi:hypothetical protein